MEAEENVVRFTLGGLLFEYDPEKKQKEYRETWDIIQECCPCVFRL